MSTTIKTPSERLFSKYCNYFSNKRLFFTSSIEEGVYSITLFDLDKMETDQLIHQFVRHFRLHRISSPSPEKSAA